MWCVIVRTKMQKKIWNFKFEVLNSKTLNIEFHSSQLQIWSFEISFWRTENFIFEVIECLLEMPKATQILDMGLWMSNRVWFGVNLDIGFWENKMGILKFCFEFIWVRFRFNKLLHFDSCFKSAEIFF